MRSLNSNELSHINGGSVYEVEDAIIWNRMPSFGLNTSDADLVKLKELVEKTNKPVKEVW